MPSYFVDGDVVTIDADTKVAAKEARSKLGTKYTLELHKVGSSFYELAKGKTLQPEPAPREWLEGLPLSEDEVVRVKKAFEE